MQASNFVLADYLERIGLTQAPAADIDGVAAMMRAQLFTVPFENLDVRSGRGVSLVPEDIVDKIVGRGRGGYCYEVNGLFAMALEALGVPYRFVAARPMFYPARRPRTHMAIVATPGGVPWLCDLGFGSYGIRAPMRLDTTGIAVEQDCDTFMLAHDDGEYLVKALIEGDWASQYAFDLSRQDWIDFAPANHMNATHPDAIFVQKLLVVLHTPNGRDILVGDTLKTVEHGKVETMSVPPDGIAEILAERFRLGSVACAPSLHMAAQGGAPPQRREGPREMRRCEAERREVEGEVDRDAPAPEVGSAPGSVTNVPRLTPLVSRTYRTGRCLTSTSPGTRWNRCSLGEACGGAAQPARKRATSARNSSGSSSATK